MREQIAPLASLLGGLAMLLSVALMLGLGMAREAPVLGVILASVGVGVLPGLGLSGLMGGRPLAFAVGNCTWALALLLGLPLYFPGERREALATGLAYIGAPFGAGATATMAQLGAALSDALGREWLHGRPPPTPLAALEPESSATEAPRPATVPSLQMSNEDEIALPYEGTGRSVRIPVIFEGKETEEQWMLFDTGATYTTLNRDALRRLGVEVPKDSPEITMQTANGERKAHIALIPRLWLGGFAVEGVTVAVCDECGGDDNEGLLGLNVSGQFTVTLDAGRQEVVLRPRGGELDRSLDVSQWVDISALATAWTDGRVVVDVTANNRAPRPIKALTVGIECAEDHFEAVIGSIAPGGEGETRVSLPRGSSCESYRIKLEAARW